MAEYSKIARGSFTTGTPAAGQVINLPFQPQRVELTSVDGYDDAGQWNTLSAFWDISMPQGTALMQYISSASSPWNVSSDHVLTGGISTFAAGLSLQYGPKIQIASMTAVSDPVVTTAVPHGLSTGDVVVFEGLYQTPTTGMPQMSGMPFLVTVTDPTTFLVSWNASTSNYTALTGSPVGAYIQKVLYPWLYQPGVKFIAAISLGSTTTVTCISNHNFVVGQEIAFRIPAAYGTVELNSLPNTVVPGSPIYAVVTSLVGLKTFTCNINSSAFTPFTVNQPVSSVPGLQHAQVLAVGDFNTGGTPYSGGSLYPSPQFPTFGSGIPTINGPAISGAFVNNTSQGFVIGLGEGAFAAAGGISAPILNNAAQYYWTAYYFDLSL